jgi:hypothetical protein
LISIYRIYLLEPMFWFKLVFQLFTSMILPARLQLQGSAFACAWFRWLPLERENYTTHQHSLTTDVSDFR